MTPGQPDVPPDRQKFSLWLTLGSAARLELLERPGPVLVQQPRQRAVGEQPPAGLAAGTVVRLVLGVDDALHRRPAHRTRLAVAAVHGHARAERGDALRKILTGLLPQPLDPLDEDVARGGEQPRRLVRGELV